MSDATRLIEALNNGDPRAAEALMPLVYQELKKLAQWQMSQERRDHTLQATALVHEAYVRLVEDRPREWSGRRHFFAAAAEAMRRILIEHARRKNALKRGAALERIPLDDDLPAISSPCDQFDDLLALNEAIDRLAEEDPAKADLVKLLYFAGLNLGDAGRALGLSRTTAYRQWVFTRAWLLDAIRGAAETEDDV